MNEKSARYHVFKKVLDLMAGMWPTPLVKLTSLSNSSREVWAKLEFYNPFSRSIKDRPIYNMLMKALKNNMLSDEIEEATSGNVGIALACLSNIYGRKFRAYLPKQPPKTTQVLLRLLGAEVVVTDYETIGPSFWKEVAQHAKSIGATNLNQFENDANFEAHYNTTAAELIVQLEIIGNKPDFILSGIGTSGHIAAISKRLKARYNNVKIIGVQPAKGSKIPGIKRVETNPKWLRLHPPDEIIDITTSEAIEGSIFIARNEGLIVGLSSGAVVKALEKLNQPGFHVLIFPDDGFKYVDYFDRYLCSSEKGKKPSRVL